MDDDGNHLSEDKILVHLTKDMIVGGTETTTHLIGNLFYNLCSTPGAYERVRNDRSLVPIAVEETLRISGPVQILFRVPNTDVTIGETEIPANSVVALGYASANRDEDVFTDADTFHSIEATNCATSTLASASASTSASVPPSLGSRPSPRSTRCSTASRRCDWPTDTATNACSSS